MTGVFIRHRLAAKLRHYVKTWGIEMFDLLINGRSLENAKTAARIEEFTANILAELSLRYRQKHDRIEDLDQFVTDTALQLMKKSENSIDDPQMAQALLKAARALMDVKNDVTPEGLPAQARGKIGDKATSLRETFAAQIKMARTAQDVVQCYDLAETAAQLSKEAQSKPAVKISA